LKKLKKKKDHACRITMPIKDGPDVDSRAGIMPSRRRKAENPENPFPDPGFPGKDATLGGTVDPVILTRGETMIHSIRKNKDPEK
jgi:hypothetical protein